MILDYISLYIIILLLDNRLYLEMFEIWGPILKTCFKTDLLQIYYYLEPNNMYFMYFC